MRSDCFFIANSLWQRLLLVGLVKPGTLRDDCGFDDLPDCVPVFASYAPQDVVLGTVFNLYAYPWDRYIAGPRLELAMITEKRCETWSFIPKGYETICFLRQLDPGDSLLGLLPVKSSWYSKVEG